MGKDKAIALVWHCKTPRGWRRFPVLTKLEHGRQVARHGFVMDKGELSEYPEGRYQLRSFIDGKQHFQTVETCHPREVIMAWDKAKRLAKPAKGQPASVALLKNAAAAYVKDRRDNLKLEAAEQARLVLDEFMAVCPTVYVRSVTSKCVEDFHKKLRRKGLTERTIANKHQRLCSFFRFLKIDTSWMPEKPAYEKSKPRIYSQAELSSIRQAADDYMRLVIDMALMLGLREQELMFAEWRDVNWDHSTFRVQAKPEYGFMTKDKEQRELPIPAILIQRLKAHKAIQPKGTRLIAATSNGTANTHLLRTLKRLAKSAGLNCGHCEGCKVRMSKVGKYQKEIKTGEECYDWTLHGFRRTCLTTMLRNGIDVRTVQEFAGHSSLETTLRYLSAASTTEMQEKMNAIFAD